jgi:hypothetical protein
MNNLPGSRLGTFCFLFSPAVFLAVTLLQKNPPVRPAGSPVLIWDIDLTLADALPRNFRTTDDPLKANNGETPSTTGLIDLHASGSGEFTADNLKLLLARTHGSVTVFDLRQETHIFVNGLPLSWFAKRDWDNVSRSQTEIEKGEAEWVQSLGPGSEIAVRPGHPVKKGTLTPSSRKRWLWKKQAPNAILSCLPTSIMCGSRLRITHGRSMRLSIDSFSLFARFQRMPGYIFTAKQDLDEPPPSWCSTICCEMPLVYR